MPDSTTNPVRRAVIIFLIGLLLMAGFVLLSDAIINTRPVLDLDADIAQAVHDAGDTPLTPLAKSITLLGNQVLYPLGFGLAIYFAVRRQWLHLISWAIATGVGQLFNMALKEWFARPRPAFPGWTNPESTYGYPSGHAMFSILAYGMLAVFAWYAVRSPMSRALALKLAGTLIILIALTRIVLNVHFFSDVIGGLIAGGLWLAVSAAIFVTLNRPPRSEPDSPPDSPLV